MLHDAEQVSSLVAVPAVGWRSFLAGFSRRHHGWLATTHGIERGVPITRIRSEALASATLIGHSPDDVVRLTFVNGVSLCASGPRAVRVQRTQDGAASALEIETADGAFVRLAFRAAPLPEHVDGMAPAELMPERFVHR